MQRNLEALSLLGDIYFEMGDLCESRKFLEEVHEISTKHNIKQVVHETCVKLCNLFKDMAINDGKITQESIKYLNKALEFSLGLNNPELECEIS